MRLRPLATAVLVASGLTLVGSLFLPTVVFQKLAAKEVYSILGGIRVLWTDGDHVLATIVFLFSVVLPIAKHLLLFGVLARRGSPAWRRRVVPYRSTTTTPMPTMR